MSASGPSPPARPFQGLGAPGELLRAPLTRALPWAGSRSAGPGRSRQAGLTRSSALAAHHRHRQQHQPGRPHRRPQHCLPPGPRRGRAPPRGPGPPPTAGPASGRAARARPVTALGRGPTALHSTAFERGRPRARPGLLGLCLLALLLLRPGAAGEAAGGSTPRRHPYNEYAWEVNQLNPWLSACDLAGPAPADLQGSCGPPEAPENCPAPCAAAGGPDAILASLGRRERAPGSSAERGPAPEQCLFYLEESHKGLVCGADLGRGGASPREKRFRLVSGLRLRHCCEHAAVNALAPGPGGPLEAVLAGGEGCASALEKLLLVDALAARLHCEFEEVLARYDCGQSYSVIHSCAHCKEAYRKWVCSSLVPYFAHGGPMDLEPSGESWTGRRLRACRSLCQSVEERCPYLLPGDRAPAYPTQYAGEPTFLCRDPNIPETGEQAARALHPNSEDECCFDVCSEEKPILGLCANCTDRQPQKGLKIPDFPTAPQCDISLLPGQQQTARSQSSFCGSGGVGSMIFNGNPLSEEPPASSPPPDSSDEPPIATTTTTITTTTISSAATTSASTGAAGNTGMSSSSAHLAAPSPVPLLCLVWFWGVLFSSRCSARCLLRLLGLAARHLRARRASHASPLAPVLGPLGRQPRDRRTRRRKSRARPNRPAVPVTARLEGAAAVAFWRDGAAAVAVLLVAASTTGCRYRWWLWPGRWKRAYRGRGFFSGSRAYRCWHRCCCYRRWLWPCRWKRGPRTGARLASVPVERRGRQRYSRPRRKRRRKVRLRASRRRGLDLAGSASWRGGPS